MALKLVIMGPPGAGKGTQAALIAREGGLSHLSTGDLLRKELAARTPLGLKAKSFMESGGLVPDAVMTDLVGQHVLRAARAEGFLLDGYPRTVQQAEGLGAMLDANGVKLDAVLNFKVPDGSIVDRLVNRLTCSNPKCQATFHKVTAPPRQAGVCDRCKGALITRKDDSEEVVRQRIKVYHDQTAPVIDFYRRQGLVREIDGTRPISEIAESIRSLLVELGGSQPPRPPAEARA